MGAIRTVFMVLGLVTLAMAASWPRRGRSQEIPGGFIGEATNELTSAIFQSYVDDASNLAFSPLGYSVILAILAEGARGETKTQLATALKLPKDEKVMRNMYQSILQRLNQTNQYKLNTPEFKNWFYVYKNYTVNDDYRKILEEFYLTEVKSVERYDSSFFQIKKEPVNKEEEKIEQINPLPSVEVKEPVVRSLPVPTVKENSKDVANFEQLLKDKEEINEDSDKKATDKDDSKKIEKSVKTETEKIISFAMEDIPENPNSELYDKSELIKSGKNSKDKKPTTALHKKELSGDYEMMEAVEARNHNRKSKSIFGRDDITNTLSANRVGSKDVKDPNSLMILFNGLYFRGSWKTPFKNIASETFYKSETEKKSVLMMEAKGTFKTGSLPGLDSIAVEIPYEDGEMVIWRGMHAPDAQANPSHMPVSVHVASTVQHRHIQLHQVLQMISLRVNTAQESQLLPSGASETLACPIRGDRYALVVVAPNSRQGLRRLVVDLPGLPPSRLTAALAPRPLKVKLPSFYVEVTTKPLAALAKFGVSSIFGPDADLSGISPVSGLFVQEMVQHVSVKVDEGGNAQAQITATNPVSHSEPNEPIPDEPESKGEVEDEELVVDRPFLFFVMDVVDNIVVIAGIVTEPEQPEIF